MQQVGPQELATPESRRDFLRMMKRRPAEPPSAPSAPPSSASSPSSSASTHWDPAMARVAPPSPWADARIRLVRRATYGPRAADIADVRAAGYQRWLNDQVSLRIDDAAVDAEVAARWPNLSRNGIDLVNVNAGTLRAELQA
ncbi:MAG: hypothetical protein ACK57A_03230, partial [Gemmatimonas sp.]